MGIIQYDIVLVNLDPTQGSEIRKTRPCVLISPDEMNRHLKTVVITPMTTSLKNYPTRVKVQLKGKTGWAALDQIRTVDQKRIIKTMGHLSSKEIQNIKNTLRETYVD